MCNLLACRWIRADGLRISHYYAKMLLTYHDCNSQQTFLCYHILMQLEIPSGMFAKLHTEAASNNRDHATQSLFAYACRYVQSFTSQCRQSFHVAISLIIACSRHAYIMVLFFTHIPFVVNHTINATPPERLQQHPLLFTTNHTDRMFFVSRLNSTRPPHPGHTAFC